ncbi:cbs domain-containing protein cbscbspb3 [Quercus suber]|uniref:Cbs domain-containing protein cbscbspb3 n=1 Tax=Quercus suber TaxID=58331 RepID=A0AAW0LGB3_QUESU
MTRNPIFVTSDSLAIEALQKMIQGLHPDISVGHHMISYDLSSVNKISAKIFWLTGKFRHLPVVENGEVIALLDITKCLYDAISRMEKAAEQGTAIAAAVEGVERQWGSNFSAPHAFIETLRDRMFKPSLSTIIAENAKVPIVSLSDPVNVAAKKMRELRLVFAYGFVIPLYYSSKDILMRVVAQNLSPELTLVEKCDLTADVVVIDGGVVSCVDVLQITQAAISMVDGSSGAVNDVAGTLMQKFWDSALALEPPDDYDTHSEMSGFMAPDGTEQGKLGSYPSLGLGNSFAFKFEDLKGRVHRVNCAAENLDELVSAVIQRIGAGIHTDHPQLLYEDDDGDRVLLATDSDLVAAISHARSVGQKVLRLHLDSSDSSQLTKPESGSSTMKRYGGMTLHFGILAGAVVLTSIGVLVYLKRSKI